MNLPNSLALGAAIATLLTALGVFLDKYHVKGTRLDRVRELLIHLWIRLQAMPMIFLYVDNSAYWTKEEQARQSHREDRRAVLLVLFMTATGIASVVWWFLTEGSDEYSWWMRTIIGMLTFVQGFFVPTFMLLALVFFLGLPFLLAQLVVLILRRLGLGVLEIASSDEATPFTYFGALIGLLGAAATVIAKTIS